MKFCVRLSGVNIGIISLYENVYALCREYLTEDAPDLIVAITEKDIGFEREMSGSTAADAYLETLAVYRKIAELLVECDTLVMHASAVAVGDTAVVFTGKSGIGKTTHTKLWLRDIPGSYVINGDKPLISMGEKIMAYGSPWCGKERMGSPCAVKLNAVCILQRAEENRIREIETHEALPMLLKQFYIPKTIRGKFRMLELLDQMTGKVKLYLYECNNFKDGAAELTWKTIMGTGT